MNRIGGFILFLLAVTLCFSLAPIIIVVNLFNSLFGTNERYLKYAILLDMFANVFAAELFNLILITKIGHQFGEYNETISYVLGFNKATDTLTKTGKFLCWVLHLVDNYHVEKVYGIKYVSVKKTKWQRIKELSLVILILLIFYSIMGSFVFLVFNWLI